VEWIRSEKRMKKTPKERLEGTKSEQRVEKTRSEQRVGEGVQTREKLG